MLFVLVCILVLVYIKEGILGHLHLLYRQNPHFSPYNIGSAYGIFQDFGGSLCSTYKLKQMMSY